jgi:dethiobiotin synthetase
MIDRRSDDQPRPHELVVIAGTGTDIGKTWLAARVLRELSATGITVAARKPAQSFDPSDRETDAHILGEASGERADAVCPHHRWYEIPMAPPMAADVLGRRTFTIAELAAELVWPSPAPRVGVVESAGGVRSPLAGDGDTVTLVEALQPDLVVLVADADLGTINGVRLSMDALDRGAHVASLVVFLNRYDGGDELHRRNRAWLADHDHFTVMTTVPDLSERVRTGIVGS